MKTDGRYRNINRGWSMPSRSGTKVCVCIHFKNLTNRRALLVNYVFYIILWWIENFRVIRTSYLCLFAKQYKNK